MMQAGELKETEYQIRCMRVQPTRPVPDIVEDVRNGLLRSPRTLPPKYLYDGHGSRLFDRICQIPEYYPTRTEDELLSKYSIDIIAEALPDQIIEIGSGSSRKTRRLFDACEVHTHTCNYAPFDVCEPALSQAATELRSEYEWLYITPLVGDYHAGLGNLPAAEGVRMLVFLGSTIGNFTPEESKEFIGEIKRCMRPGDYFLLGADRVKDTSVLNAAYNDAEGITAEFNLNVLRVLNRELGANFNLQSFSHRAFFNEEFSQIEMYLISETKQNIHLAKIDTTICLDSGEKILTEISRKFHFSELESMLIDSDLKIVKHFQPANQYFSLVLAQLSGQ